MNIRSMDAINQQISDKAVNEKSGNVALIEAKIASIRNSNARTSIGVGKEEGEISEKFVAEIIEKANRVIAETNRRFEYSFHDKINEVIVKVIDSETNEVIREIPPKKILDLVASLMEMAGIIVDERR